MLSALLWCKPLQIFFFFRFFGFCFRLFFRILRILIILNYKRLSFESAKLSPLSSLGNALCAAAVHLKPLQSTSRKNKSCICGEASIAIFIWIIQNTWSRSCRNFCNFYLDYSKYSKQKIEGMDPYFQLEELCILFHYCCVICFICSELAQNQDQIRSTLFPN